MDLEQQIKALAVATAKAIKGFSDCGERRHFDPVVVGEIEAALRELEPPAEWRSFLSDGEIASMVSGGLVDSRAIFALAREVQAWREVFDAYAMRHEVVSPSRSALIDHGFHSVFYFTSKLADLRRRSKGES